MKYFLDTEFLDDGKTIELISIGIIREDGAEYYAESLDFNWSRSTEWLRKNVFPSLLRNIKYFKNEKEIKEDILNFVEDDDKVEFWGYFADYDWVVLCQLWGPMIDLPRIFPHFCMDLMQLQKSKDIRIKQEDSIHNALEDARWIKQTYEKLERP